MLPSHAVVDKPLPSHRVDGAARRDDTIALRTASGRSVEVADLQLLLDALGGSAMLVDEEHRVVGANAALAASLGSDKCDMVGQQCTELVHGLNGPPAGCPLEALLAQGRAEATSDMAQRPSGSLRRESVRSTGLCTAQGARVFLCQSHDVTRERTAQQQAIETELQFRAVLDSAADAIYVNRVADGCFTEVNQAACELLGYSRDELLRLDPAAIVDDDRPEQHFEQWAEALVSGEVVEFATANRTRDGRRVPVEVRSRIIDLGGELAVVSVARDVTERERTATALAHQHDTQHIVAEILELALDDLPFEALASEVLERIMAIEWLYPQGQGALFLTDESGAALRMVASCGIDDDSQRRCARVPFGHCLCGRAAAGGELLATRHLDERHETHCQATADHGHYCVPIVVGDRTVGLINISLPAGREPVAGEQQFLSSVAAALALVVAHQQSETARDQLTTQLRHSQKMDALGRLAAGVAHDFNNLLSVVLSCTDLLRDAVADGGEAHDDLDDIEQAARRASELTRQLLTLGRKELARPEVLDVDGAVRDLERLLRRSLHEDVALHLRLDAAPCAVLMDRGLLEQVLLNLVVNAGHAMPLGGELIIHSEQRRIDDGAQAASLGLEPGELVAIEVADSGHGMSATVRERIFEPFFTTKERGQGTGLGLATAYGIIRQAGGTIEVRSEPNRGSCFTLLLPTVSTAIRPSQAPAPCAQLDLRPLTVLLVEDDPLVRSSTRRLLRRAGHRVIDAADGTDALARAGRHDGPIELLLSDVVMPGIDGHRLARLLSRTRPALRVLFMSGHSDDAVNRRGRVDGGGRLLRKPFDEHELLTAMAGAYRDGPWSDR